MKNTFWICAALMLLAACGGADDSAPAANEAAPATAVEEMVDDAVSEAAAGRRPCSRSWKSPQPSPSQANRRSCSHRRTRRLRRANGSTRKIRTSFGSCPRSQRLAALTRSRSPSFSCTAVRTALSLNRKSMPGPQKNRPMSASYACRYCGTGAVALHAQLYYTEEVLARNGVIKDPAAFHEAVFTEYHRRGNRLASEASIQTLFAAL